MILLLWKPQNNFPKTNIFLASENGFYTIFVVAMVTNMAKNPEWYTLCHLVSSPLKGTLYHLVSCGGTISGIMTLGGPIIPLVS